MKRNLEDFPEIAKEWHPTKNGVLKANDLFGKSNSRYWWLCEKGHDWDALLSERTSKKTKCPYCDGHKVCEDNCLLTVFPEIAKEWHPTKNGILTPRDVTSKSGKRVWWLCGKCGNDWDVRVHSRVNHGCPNCVNQKVCNDNCLQTKFPLVAAEWHPLKNGVLTPKDVVPGSAKIVWWLCSKGHYWKAPVYERTRIKSGRNPHRRNTCPYCSGKKVSLENCLATRFPEIAKEWHPTKNGLKTPYNVIAGSHKIYWFQCPNGHEWPAHLNNRTGGNIKTKCGCPQCRFKTQEKVRDIFQKLLGVPFPRAYPNFLKRLEYDGANVDLKLAFEYDGEYHDIPHYKATNPEKFLKDVKERDARKDRLSKENGWTLIRIHHSQKNRLEECVLEKLKELGITPTT